jgi:hypothetical protein
MVYGNVRKAVFLSQEAPKSVPNVEISHFSSLRIITTPCMYITRNYFLFFVGLLNDFFTGFSLANHRVF